MAFWCRVDISLYPAIVGFSRNPYEYRMFFIMETDQNRTIDEAKLNITSIFQTTTGDHAIIDHVADNDEEILVALGYKQEFKRDFSIWSSFSVSFACLGLLPSIASTLVFNLGYIGLSGSVWGWLVAALFIQCVALAMAELCSSMPTAGGLYYASAVLAPEGSNFPLWGREPKTLTSNTGWGPLCSWVSSSTFLHKQILTLEQITGWSNFLGVLTAPASLNFSLSLMILTAAQISNPEYIIQNWHVYLLLLAILFIQGCIAMNSTQFLGRFNLFGATANFVMVFVFIIWMPVGSINTPKTNSNREVWIEGFVNGTEWPDGFAFLMGFLSVIVSYHSLSDIKWCGSNFS